MNKLSSKGQGLLEYILLLVVVVGLVVIFKNDIKEAIFGKDMLYAGQLK